MTVLALLACTAAAACGALIGFEDLPAIHRGPDGGVDAQPEASADGSSLVRPDAGQPGALDPSFGDRGITIVDLPFQPVAPSLVLDGDAFTLLALDAVESNLHVVRCSRAGVCDGAHATTILVPPYGVTRAVPVADPRGEGVLIQATASGVDSAFENTVYLWRLARDGGVTELARETLPAPSTEIRTALAVGATRIISLDNSEPKDAGRLNVRAFLYDGGPDLPFGQRGVVAFEPPFQHFVPFAGHAEEDGQIVVAGFAHYDDHVVWLRFESDGGVDPSFGSKDGLGRSKRIVTVGAMIPDEGGYVLGGRQAAEPATLLRLTRDGRPDPSYWNDGVYQFARAQDDDGGRSPMSAIRALALDSRGGILALGIFDTAGGSGQGVALARATRSGLDRTFGREGQVVVDEGEVLGPASMIVLPEGKVVITWLGADGFVKLARFVLE